MPSEKLSRHFPTRPRDEARRFRRGARKKRARGSASRLSAAAGILFRGAQRLFRRNASSGKSEERRKDERRKRRQSEGDGDGGVRLDPPICRPSAEYRAPPGKIVRS